MSERDEPPVIDHNPHEKRQTMAIWFAVWPLIAVFWIGCLYFGWIDWTSVFLGLGTGCALAIWATEITGNEVPESWRKAAGRR